MEDVQVDNTLKYVDRHGHRNQKSIPKEESITEQIVKAKSFNKSVQVAVIQWQALTKMAT